MPCLVYHKTTLRSPAPCDFVLHSHSSCTDQLTKLVSFKVQPRVCFESVVPSSFCLLLNENLYFSLSNKGKPAPDNGCGSCNLR